MKWKRFPFGWDQLNELGTISSDLLALNQKQNGTGSEQNPLNPKINPFDSAQNPTFNPFDNVAKKQINPFEGISSPMCPKVVTLLIR